MSFKQEVQCLGCDDLFLEDEGSDQMWCQQCQVAEPELYQAWLDKCRARLEQEMADYAE